MPSLVWDRLEDRRYEIGVDHGVLYVADENGVQKGVPWNGLTEVKKGKTRETTKTYFDGAKIHNYVQQTEFEGEISAITFPPEFEALEGLVELKCGISIGEQPPGLFGLSYRSTVGDALGEEQGYKLHILFNLYATPADRVYQSIDKSPKLMEFSWDVESVPEPVRNARPTAEIILDSRVVDPWLMEDLENILYGSPESDAYLPSMTDLVQFIDDWYRIKITLLPDGQFKITEGRDGTYLTVTPSGEWTLKGANALKVKGPGREIWDFILGDDWELTQEDYELWQEVWYNLGDTICQGELPTIKITDNGDGTWTADTDYDNLIFVNEDETMEVEGEQVPNPFFGYFMIRNATLIWQSDTAYRITDTLPDY